MDYDEHINKNADHNWDMSLAKCLHVFKRTGKFLCPDCATESRPEKDADGIVSCETCGLALSFDYCVDVWLRNKPLT